MRVLFYPDMVREFSKMWRLIEMLNVTQVNDSCSSYDVPFFWSHHKKILPYDPILQDLRRIGAINIGGIDVRKTRVEEVMLKVFGYNSLIDCKNTGEKKFIQKNDRQTNPNIQIITNDGTYVNTPGTINAKLLTDYVDGMYRSYRCVIAYPKIVFTTENYYDANNRFDHVPAKKNMVSPESWLTVDEMRKLVAYAKKYGTIFTELDIIRHDDGKIYVIDNNNVPARINPYPGNDAFSDSYYATLKDELSRILQEWKPA